MVGNFSLIFLVLPGSLIGSAVFILVPFYLTYCLYFSIEHKKVKKRSEENDSISFSEK